MRSLQVASIEPTAKSTGIRRVAYQIQTDFTHFAETVEPPEKTSLNSQIVIHAFVNDMSSKRPGADYKQEEMTIAIIIGLGDLVRPTRKPP